MKAQIFKIRTSLSLVVLSFFCFLWFSHKEYDETATKILFSTTLFAISFLVFHILSHLRSLGRWWNFAQKSLRLEKNNLLSALNMPVVLVGSNRNVLWYNLNFRKDILLLQDALNEKVDESLPCFEALELTDGFEFKMEVWQKTYLAHVSLPDTDEPDIFMVCLVEISELEALKEKYEDEKTAVAIIMIDNLDMVLQKTSELDRVRVEGDIEYVIKNFFEQIAGIAQKTEKDRFLVILCQKQLNILKKQGFPILSLVRHINCSSDIAPTISIGISESNTGTLSEKEQDANRSLDMALGRGGDQVAIKSGESYIFFGGVAMDTEQRSSVKVRIVASALADLIENSDNVLVMGHKFADLDCFGAGIGIAKIVRSFNKPVRFVINRVTSMVGEEILNRFLSLSDYKSIIAEPDELAGFVTERTLVIIVDLHVARLVEYQKALSLTRNVVIIDHHRKMVDHINNTLLFHHEPFASSASEMVTELIRYFGSKVSLTKLEAEALLSGIVLDTKGFVLKTGARTFRSASLLKSAGASTIEIKKLFASTIEEYKQISEIIASAKLIYNCAICITNGRLLDTRLVIAKAADSLLGIRNVEASFVICESDQGCFISARSLGKVNVQVIMEMFGGGGHQIMAAAQVYDKPGKEIAKIITTELANIFKE